MAHGHVLLGVEVDDLVHALVFGAVAVDHVVAQFSVLFAQSGDAGLRHLCVERFVLQVDLLVVVL